MFSLFTEELVSEGLMRETTTGLTCLICGYSNLLPFSVMKRHIEGKHSCYLCDKICKTENDRSLHMKIHEQEFVAHVELILTAEEKSQFVGSKKEK